MVRAPFAWQTSEHGLFGIANSIVEGVAGTLMLLPNAPLTPEDAEDLHWSNSVADVVMDAAAEPHVAAVYVQRRPAL